MKDIIIQNNIILIPQKNCGYSVVAFCVAAGAKYDPPEKSGVAHVLEHILIASSESTQDLYAETQLEQLFFQSTQLPEKTSENLKNLYTLLFTQQYNSKHFKLQKERVTVEIRSQHNHEGYAEVYTRMFGGDSAQTRGWSGNAQTISHITEEDIKNHQAQYVRPERSVCVITGEFNVAQIQAVLAELKLEHTCFVEESLPLYTTTNKCLLNIERSTDTASVHIFFKLPQIQDFQARVYNRMYRNLLLGTQGYITNLLYRETAHTYNIIDSASLWTNGGIRSIEFETSIEQIDTVRDTLMSFFSSPRTHITETDFNRAREQTILHYTILFKDTDDITLWYGEDLLLTGAVHSYKETMMVLKYLSFKEFMKYVESFGVPVLFE